MPPRITSRFKHFSKEHDHAPYPTRMQLLANLDVFITHSYNQPTPHHTCPGRSRSTILHVKINIWKYLVMFFYHFWPETKNQLMDDILRHVIKLGYMIKSKWSIICINGVWTVSVELKHILVFAPVFWWRLLTYVRMNNIRNVANDSWAHNKSTKWLREMDKSTALIYKHVYWCS